VLSGRQWHFRKQAYRLFSDNLDQDAFIPQPIKLTIENLFLGAEIEFAIGQRYHDF